MLNELTKWVIVGSAMIATIVTFVELASWAAPRRSRDGE